MRLIVNGTAKLPVVCWPSSVSAMPDELDE